MTAYVLAALTHDPDFRARGQAVAYLAGRANYAGTCAGCGDRFPEGTPIRLIEGYGWCHDRCPDPTNVTGPAEVSCTACWLIHPEGECDR